ncbi:CoA transferase [Streptomyces sp. SP18CS02]|uniref:CoA transferase n=1 Tax=Streptomyces sp. SP18CS02 TaxID=3002531 RepID=UPI002E77EF86|nr:CoA transferase [Streptomyces sp. SP18CS02]MEE1754794.1 CoA transferase [Streptomyces sp. SP18CS02]
MNQALHPGTGTAWAALGADPALLDRVTYGGAPGGLPARTPVMDLARSSVAVCSLAAAELAAARTGGPVPRVRVDDGAVTAAFLSDRLVRLDGQAWSTFAPLSRFWRAADGWVRTHANYPHHRGRLLDALALPPDAGADAVAEVIAGRRATDVEDTVYAAGGLAVAARDARQWAEHEQGALVAKHPLLTLERIGDAPPRRPGGGPGSGGRPLPCAGLRVLDLTRVLAGPVATRTLALLGADVLRIDAPQLPESQEAHNDTGMGKRSATLDLGDRHGDRQVFEELLSGADVVVLGYRPGGLDRFGLTPEELVARRPGLVVAQLSAWGRYGPWGERRGFDSLVQVATGIAALEGGAPGDPDGPGPLGALPAQALDHGTGYLLAAAVLRALTEQHRAGGSTVARLALAQTAHWLVHGLVTAPGGGTAPGGAAFDAERRTAVRDSPMGRLRYALSPVGYEGGPADWARPPGLWGTDAPGWLRA